MKFVWWVLALLLWSSSAGAQDGIDLSRATFHGSPNAASWPIGVTLRAAEFAPGADKGVSPLFNRQEMNARWPDVTPPGWNGPIQFTLWVCVKVGGWHCAGLLEFWGDRGGAPKVWSGAPWLERGVNGGLNWNENWAYRSVWGPMTSYVPKLGDEVGFFLTAGDQRNPHDIRSVTERTNVIKVKLATQGVALPLQPDPVSGVPDAPTVPAPTLPPVVPVGPDYGPKIAALEQAIQVLTSQLAAHVAYLNESRAWVTEQVDALGERVTAIEARPLFSGCEVNVFGVGVRCRLR